MKKLFYSLLLMLFGASSFAQHKITPWTLDIFYSPQYVQHLGNSVLKKTTLIQPSYSYTLGFGINKRLNEKMAINVGFSYAGSSNKSSGGLRWGSDHDGNGGYAGPSLNNPDLYAFKEYAYYFQMPIGVRFYLSEGAWNFYLQPGVDGEVLLGKRNAYLRKNEEGKTLIVAQNNEEITRQFSILGALRVGVERSVNSRFSLFLEPEYSMSLVNVSSLIAAGSTKRSNLGLRIGARLGLRP